MTRDEARAAVQDAITKAVPGSDPSAVDPGGRLRDELDLDSMDFLAIVQRVYDGTGVEVPEVDYARVDTLDDFVEYVLAHQPAPAPG